MTGVCPHCGGPSEYQSARYPDALCDACCRRATDAGGRRVVLGNESLSGGFLAQYEDGSPCEQVMRENRVLIDGRRFHAGEAHMGGVVIRPVPR